jgi:DNA end-binding protein Ku
VKVAKKELAMADQLIESLSEPFDPESYHDDYREQVMALIDRKADGEEIVAEVTPAPSADKVIDLMAALEASVAEAKESRRRHPTAQAAEEESGEESDGEERPARKQTARRRSAPATRRAKAPAKKATARKAPAKRKSA